MNINHGLLRKSRRLLPLLAFSAMSCAAPVEPGTSEDSNLVEDTAESTSALITGGRFGTWCTRQFQNAWQTELPHAWNLCDGFVGTMDNTATNAFYFDLNNKKFYWEAGGDHQPANDSADDVDLLFVNTHGGAPSGSTTASYAMWNQNQFALTTSMRLGDSATWGGGLAILATYACETLRVSDNKLPTRWGAALRGGLKMILGSHGTVFDSDRTDDTGTSFADKLQHGTSIRSSWRGALYDTFVAQDVAVVATGSDMANCTSRRDAMNWQNFGSYPFLRDGQIGATCWVYWDDL
jgi:hypothetical protein